MRVAEIYLDVELSLKLLVADEENIVVPGSSFHFRKAFFHPFDSIFQSSNGNRKDFFKKRVAELPVGVYKQESFSVSSRRDEVAFHVADSLFRVDNLRSFVDTALVLDSRTSGFLASPFPCEFLAMSLNLSSVGTGDICSDGHSGDIWQVFVVLLYPFRGEFRRLIIKQVCFHGCSKLRMKRDGVWTNASVFVLHVRVVVSVCRVVFSSFPRALRYFV